MHYSDGRRHIQVKGPAGRCRAMMLQQPQAILVFLWILRSGSLAYVIIQNYLKCHGSVDVAWWVSADCVASKLDRKCLLWPDENEKFILTRHRSENQPQYKGRHGDDLTFIVFLFERRIGSSVWKTSGRKNPQSLQSRIPSLKVDV